MAARVTTTEDTHTRPAPGRLLDMQPVGQSARPLRWVNVLHIYQPPHMGEAIVRDVARESYERIILLLKAHSRLKLTVNLSGSLVELLKKNDLAHIIDDFRRFAEEGRVELMASAMYHPILPLIPVTEAKRQIEENTRILSAAIGDAYKPRGFYAPELAYTAETLKLIESMGFSWVLMDELHARAPIDWSAKNRIEGTKLLGIFRHRVFSKTFPPEHVSEHFTEAPRPYLVTAHDGELYGHWHKDDKGYYARAFDHPDITFLTGSEYLGELTAEQEISVREGTWETTAEDYAANNPYPLWRDAGNALHEKMWELADFCARAIGTHRDDPNFEAAERHLSRGLVSCGWWWASAKVPVITSPVMWAPDEVEKVLNELVKSVRSLETLPADEKISAERMYADATFLLWDMHWSGFGEKPAA